MGRNALSIPSPAGEFRNHVRANYERLPAVWLIIGDAETFGPKLRPCRYAAISEKRESDLLKLVVA
jgi:hypothetical protein